MMRERLTCFSLLLSRSKSPVFELVKSSADLANLTKRSLASISELCESAFILIKTRTKINQLHRLNIGRGIIARGRETLASDNVRSLDRVVLCHFRISSP